ncbi:outer membrane beta-barrel protein [Fusobacterium nucleatum]|uniref:outer membrane beta-barrel protein n=1 Tax=Fusobacterium nucleatum TaxID=851 RepID=UPI003D046185
MKKILLGLFAIMSISAMAANKGVNVYGRFGLDIYSHYNQVSQKDPILEARRESSMKAKGKVAPSIAIEITKDLNTKFEAGIGIGYVWHGKRDLNEKIFDADGDFTGTIDGKVPAVNSIPLYLTGKYKFDTNSDFKPYIKADLGYSFNRVKKSSFDVSVQQGGVVRGYTEYTNLKAKNGIYTAIGVGLEYNNITADLSYVFTGAKIRMSKVPEVLKSDETRTFKANNSAIRLTVGYKFSF